MHLADFRWRGLLHRRRKVRVFVWKGIWKNIISYYSSAFTIIHNHDAEVFAPIASCSVKIHPNMSLLFCMQVLSNPILIVYMMKRLSQKILSKPGKTAPTKNPAKVWLLLPLPSFFAGSRVPQRRLGRLQMKWVTRKHNKVQNLLERYPLINKLLRVRYWFPFISSFFLIRNFPFFL